MPTPVLMPALSPTMEKGNLAKWLKREGEAVKSGDVIAEIETDKATMEVEAVDEGTLGKILVPEGTADVAVNTPIAMILINRQPTAISKVYDMLQPGTPIFAVVGAPTIIQPAAISMLFHWRSPGHGEGLQWNELDFTLATMEAWHGRRLPDRVYHQIPTAETPAPSSFLSCLDRYAIDRKRTLRFEPRTNMLLARYKGEVSAREKLSQGTEFRSTALKLSLVEN